MWNTGDRIINKSGRTGTVISVDSDGENVTVQFDDTGETGRFGRSEDVVLDRL